MSVPSTIRGRALVAALVALALAGIVTIGPAEGAPTAPPDGTYEIHLLGSGVLSEGGQQIAYEATCWNTAPNTGVTASIWAYLPPSPGSMSFGVMVVSQHPIDANGFVAGQFHLTTNAPNGTYIIRLICNDADGEAGRSETSLRVDRHIPDIEEPGPSAVVPSEPPPIAFAAPPPAAPVHTQPTLTG